MTSPPPSADDPTAPTPAGLAYPTRTKVIVVGVLAVAIGLIVLAGLSTSDGGDDVAVSGGGDAQGQDASGTPPADGVERVFPRDGAEILGQERIGIDLAPGWTGELMLVKEGGEAVTLPEDELLRDELNQIFYQPGPDMTVERLSGEYCVAATIWDQARGREASQRVETWCFHAT
ncbi:MAG TPA: hypothetical protein VFU14_09305 [Acidimicrobiales bacterium]|nr:hypothetical protein [Acidimicrobiales bacterium]